MTAIFAVALACVGAVVLVGVGIGLLYAIHAIRLLSGSSKPSPLQ